MIASARTSDSVGGQDRPKQRLETVVVDVGNSTVSVARWVDGGISHRTDTPLQQAASSFPEQPCAEVMKHIAELASQRKDVVLPVVICSVVPVFREALVAGIRSALNVEPYVVGDQIPLPCDVKLDEPDAVGVDRVCASAAAYEAKKEPCIVVDFGSAITVGLVDGEGAFAGGAILPGLAMQSVALHEQTAVLPLVKTNPPTGAIGTNTTDAIRAGIWFGAAGAVRHLVEQMAERIGRWPPVVATGGQAAELSQAVGIFDNVVPDLCLLGVGIAYRKWNASAVIL